MFKILLSWFLLLSICPGQNLSFLRESAAKKNFNTLYPGDPAIDAVYYLLNIKFNFENKSIVGDVLGKFRVAADSSDTATLDLASNLIVDSVHLNGKPAMFVHSADSQLKIIFGHFIKKNNLFSIRTFYHGTPATSGYGSFSFVTFETTDAIYSLSQPYGSKDWWPCKDTPLDKADSADINFNVRSDLYAVSNGSLEEIEKLRNGTTTYKWKSRYPIAPYLISIAAANYELYTNYYKYSESDSLSIYHFLYPGFLNETMKKRLDLTPDMLKIFDELYGPYPFLKEKYGHAQFGFGGGMEHQTISSMGAPAFSETVIAHELAHQWFGDKITCSGWENIWINEGFATYSEALYLEMRYGKDFYKNHMISRINQAYNAVGSIYLNDISGVSSIFNYAKTYAKGAVILHMLRAVTGDKIFFRILKEYSLSERFEYGNAGVEDFRAIAETIYGKSLEYFFNQWIYGVGYPKYTFSWDAEEISNNHYNFEILIEQEENFSPSFFIMPVQIKIEHDNGDSLITLFNDLQKQSFALTLPFRPNSVKFDPDNLILCAKKETTQIIKNKTIVKTYSLGQNYPNPFNPATTIEIKVPSAGKISVKIYDLLGKECAVIYDKHTLPGSYKIRFDSAGLPAGVYYYKLVSDNYSAVRKMVILK